MPTRACSLESFAGHKYLSTSLNTVKRGTGVVASADAFLFCCGAEGVVAADDGCCGAAPRDCNGLVVLIFTLLALLACTEDEGGVGFEFA